MKTTHMLAILFTMLLITPCAYSQQWKQYKDSAKVYEEQQEWDKAIAFYSKVREALKKDSIGTNSYAGSCNYLANLYLTLGQYEKAEPLYLEAKGIYEKAVGKLHPSYANSCSNLGLLYMYMGLYQKAEPLFLEAKGIYEKAVGKLHPDYANSCNYLASLYLEMGQYEKAEPLYLEAKVIYEKTVGKLHPSYANSCNNLARLYMYMGLYQKAEPLYLEAKGIREKAVGKLHSDYAGSCNNLALLYRNMGQYEKAEPLYLEAKGIYEKALGKLHPSYAGSCNNLANLYRDMGQYAKAEPLYLESKGIREKVLGKLHPSYAGSCNNLANLYRDMGQYAKAGPLYLEAKQIYEKALGKLHPSYAGTCNNLALLYRDMGQYAKAEPLYLEAKGIQEKTVGKLHRDYAESCNNLGNLYLDMGLYQKAELLYLEAKGIQEKTVGKLHPFYAGTCNNLALLYRDMGQYAKAESLYMEAKGIQERVLGKLHPDYYESCKELANLYRNMKELEKAKDLYAEAFTSQQVQVKNIFRFTSEPEKQDYLRKVADFEDYYLSFDESANAHSDHGFSYDLTLSQRNLILTSSQQLRHIIYNTKDTSIQNKYKAWMEVRKQLAFWYAKPVSNRPAYVKNLEEQANTLEKELSRLSVFKEGNAVTEMTWKVIQQSLQAGEAAIEFVKYNSYDGKRWTDSTYYVALLLRKDKAEPELIRLFESRQLNNLLRVSNTYSSINTLYNSAERTNTIYNLIWKPVEPHLSGIKKIYFAPAGLLFRVSFAALPINDHQVLSDKYELVRLNTTADVVNQSDNLINASDNIYLYGAIRYDVDSAALKQAVLAYNSNHESTHSITDDPITRSIPDDSARGSSLNYLPGTAKEIEAISSLGKLKGYAVVVISGESATEERVKAMNGSASSTVLHMATHGFFFPDPKEKRNSIPASGNAQSPFRWSDNPLMRSGLCLAGANNAWKGKPIEGVEDGILTSFEVSNLYLPNTKLAVLSACQTGLGDIQGNESVYGLQRAFKIAGVENLVMSLWAVPDAATAEFMQEFYKNIFEKQSIHTAFENAQTAMKNKYRNEPYNWAAWVLVR